MAIYITVAALQLTAMAAFLILWYFWLKRRLQSSSCADEAEQELLPFRHFCHLLLSLVFFTCMIQIYFLWTSSTIRERIACVTSMCKKQEKGLRAIAELTGMIESLRKESATNSLLLQTRLRGQVPNVKDLEAFSGAGSPPEGLLAGKPLNSQTGRASSDNVGFGREAKASSAASIHRASGKRFQTRNYESDRGYSMDLNRQGHVVPERLRVHKRPQPNSEIIEKLSAGQRVKVTEKRLLRDSMWFRVITPSGRAGWVDFRYLTLDGSA